jgi:hypothetical protein
MIREMRHTALPWEDSAQKINAECMRSRPDLAALMICRNFSQRIVAS